LLPYVKFKAHIIKNKTIVVNYNTINSAILFLAAKGTYSAVKSAKKREGDTPRLLRSHPSQEGIYWAKCGTMVEAL
jgi:hypothetical protein